MDATHPESLSAHRTSTNIIYLLGQKLTGSLAFLEGCELIEGLPHRDEADSAL